MLKKENRICKRTDFLNVKEKGRIYQSPFFGLIYLKNEINKSQFGFIISKRISKRAVDRNRIKRYLSESVKRHGLENDKGWKIVFLTKREILSKSFLEVDNEVIRVFSQLKLND